MREKHKFQMAVPRDLDAGLPVPEEIRELFDEAQAARDCRDKCVGSVFKAKRAIYYAKLDIQCRRKAWQLVFELWPEVKVGKWHFNATTATVRPGSWEDYEQ